MNIKDKLAKLKGENNLKDYVINYFLEEDNVKEQMEDLQRYGCKSGIIGSLIYYSDTKEFYNKYKSEINELAKDIIDGTGVKSIFDLIPSLETDDPLMIETHNMNILAWFGFEEMTYKLYDTIFEERDIEYEIER